MLHSFHIQTKMATGNHTRLYSNHSVPALLWLQRQRCCVSLLRSGCMCHVYWGRWQDESRAGGEKEKTPQGHMANHSAGFCSQLRPGHGVEHCDVQHTRTWNTTEQCPDYTLVFGECVGLVKMSPVMLCVVQNCRDGKRCVLICAPSSLKVPVSSMLFIFISGKHIELFVVKI